MIITFKSILLIGILVWAVYGDLAEGRIPNVLTVSAFLFGLLLNTIIDGYFGFKFALAGAVMAGGVFLFIYLVGLTFKQKLMGAGDVKLMAGIGAFLGPWGALWTILYGLWIAGLSALALVVYCAIRRRPIPKTMPFGACLAVGGLVTNSLRTNLTQVDLAEGAHGLINFVDFASGVLYAWT